MGRDVKTLSKSYLWRLDLLMLELLKKRKFEIIFFLLFFIILLYTHLNTFVANDDLPYSLFFRQTNRITNIMGVIKNQVFDYCHISSRIIVHSIVQFLLIFNKNLWSILNPIMILLTIQK